MSSRISIGQIKLNLNLKETFMVNIKVDRLVQISHLSYAQNSPIIEDFIYTKKRLSFFVKALPNNSTSSL